MQTASLRFVAATLVNVAALGAGPDAAVGLVARMLPEGGATAFRNAGCVAIFLVGLLSLATYAGAR